MPEQPEVERAARRLRDALLGRRLATVVVLHPALRRVLDDDALATLRGRTVVAVERRGKHQFVRLDDGRVLHVHFRMAGDWTFGRTEEPLPRHARAHLDGDDGQRVSLVDPRALSSIALLPAGTPLPRLGPEADDPALTARSLGGALARRRGPIKPALLDQRVIAGVGNIYAAEALWHARIDPRVPASSLGPARLERLLAGIRTALAEGTRAATRYSDDADGARLAVYGREGEACLRCATTIRRIVQAGRATYFCPRCQRR